MQDRKAAAAKRAAKGKSELSVFCTQCAGAGLGSFIAAAVLFALTTALITRIDMSHELYQPIATLNASLAVMVSSYFSSRKRQKDGLALGAATGALVFAVSLLVSYFTGNIAFTEQLLYKMIAVLSAGGLGGVFGVNSKKTALPPARV